MVGGAARQAEVSGVPLIRWIEGRQRLDWWLSALVLVLAAGDAWASRHQVGPDGISYLDVATVVFAHGIRAGASVAWSPAYTWIVGAALELVRPSGPDELTVVMAVNVLIVAVVLAAFAWWLRELFALLRHRNVRLVGSEPILRVLAYSVLAWAVLSRVTSSVVEPDMLLGAVGFAATALLMRIGRLGGSAPAWLGLGVLLGVGYLVKSGFVLPALVACAACAVLTTGGGARRLGALGLTLGACVCVAAPFVAVLSSKEGKLELGGYGTLNYAWDVDGVTRYLNWTGGNGDFGRPVHPTLIARSPLTFAYPSPVAGSIPVWYDPLYWYQGVRTRLVLGGQIRALASGIKATVHTIVVGPLILLLVPLGLLWWGRRRDRAVRTRVGAWSRAGPRWRRTLRALADNAYLALAVAGILTYVPLLVADRYIAIYVAIIVITAFLFACGRLAGPDLRRTIVDRVALATALVALVTFLFSARHPVEHVAQQLRGADAPGTDDLRIARALARAGISSGDGVAFLGDTDAVLRAYWARLDSARVVANIDDRGGVFWRLPPAAQADRLALVRARSGARLVLSDEAAARSAAGWIPIEGTGDSYRRLDGS
jgi:hypothetical protein